MGLVIQSDNVTIKDGSGNTRFTTDRRMPHLLFSYSGSIAVPNARGTCEFSAFPGVFDGSPFVMRGAFTCDDTRDFLIATDARITSADAFVMPFFSVSGGDIDTAGGSITGSGSSIVRLLVDTSGYFVGAMVLSPVVIGNSLILRVKTTAYSGSEVSNYPYVDDNFPGLDEAGSLDLSQYHYTELSGTSSTIGYRIYYGRFT